MKFLRLSSTAAVLTIAFAGPAMAADVNTYRPGQVYAASPMPNADVLLFANAHMRRLLTLRLALQHPKRLARRRRDHKRNRPQRQRRK